MEHGGVRIAPADPFSTPAARTRGDIAISLFDATVAFDGEVLWRDGRFVFMDRPEIRALARDYPGSRGRLDDMRGYRRAAPARSAS